MKTKLEFATALLPLVIALQEKGINIDIEVTPNCITIWQYKEPRGIEKRLDIITLSECRKAINYLKSI